MEPPSSFVQGGYAQEVQQQLDDPFGPRRAHSEKLYQQENERQLLEVEQRRFDQNQRRDLRGQPAAGRDWEPWKSNRRLFSRQRAEYPAPSTPQDRQASAQTQRSAMETMRQLRPSQGQRRATSPDWALELPEEYRRRMREDQEYGRRGGK